MGHSLLTKKCKYFFPTWIQITWLKKLFLFHCYPYYLKGMSIFAMAYCSELEPFSEDERIKSTLSLDPVLCCMQGTFCQRSWPTI